MSFKASFHFAQATAGLEALQRAAEVAMARTLEEVADRLITEIRRTAPSKTGKYKDSWIKGKRARNRISISTPMGELYAILEFEGRTAGPIYGNPILRFEINGVVLYRHMVNHPGFPPIPHARPALNKVLRDAPNIYMRHVKAVTKVFR